MSVYMYLKINALGDYKKKYAPFARLLALKRGVGVCSVVGVVSGFYGICFRQPVADYVSLHELPARPSDLLAGQLSRMLKS